MLKPEVVVVVEEVEKGTLVVVITDAGSPGSVTEASKSRKTLLNCELDRP